MITKKIKISNDGSGMNEALDLAEQTAEQMKLERKSAFYLRLLVEEMLSMVRAIAENFSAEFWIEEENFDCKLRLKAKSELNYTKRRELMSISTDGTNTSARGIMEKIREIIEASFYSFDESMELQSEYGVGILSYGALGAVDTAMSEAIYTWSMQKYKSDVQSRREENENHVAIDAWDELEKSIIANVADEVNVGVRKDSIELTVQKNFNGGNKKC